MTDDTIRNLTPSPNVEPLTWFVQDAARVTLLPNAADEYDVHITLDEGADLKLSWFEAVLLGKAISSAGDVAGRANTAWRTQLHVEQWTTWLAEQLGVDDVPSPGPADER